MRTCDAQTKRAVAARPQFTSKPRPDSWKSAKPARLLGGLPRKDLAKVLGRAEVFGPQEEISGAQEFGGVELICELIQDGSDHRGISGRDAKLVGLAVPCEPLLHLARTR
jgi:hypothetical protein